MYGILTILYVYVYMYMYLCVYVFTYLHMYMYQKVLFYKIYELCSVYIKFSVSLFSFLYLFIFFYVASKFKNQIYEAGKNDKLVYLDCDASFPAEIISLNIHPIIVYIQISRLKVLRKLIRETCRDSTGREQLLSAAYRLYDLPPVSDHEIFYFCKYCASSFVFTMTASVLIIFSSYRVNFHM